MEKAKQMNRKIFITDFDGTLLRDDKRIAKADIDALNVLGEQGVTRVVATGRSIYSFRKIMAELSLAGGDAALPVDYIIFSTGAGIMDFPACKILKRFSLSGTDVVAASEYFENRKLDYMVHRPIPHTNYFLFRHHGGYNPDFHSRIALYSDFCAPLTGSVNGFGAATGILAIVPENSADVIEDVKRDLTKFSVIVATSPLDKRSFWIEVFHPRVSKSQAAAEIARQESVDQKDIASVGNDYNDRDLMEWSGRGFVVENAPPALRKIFETVPSNNSCGVANAAEMFLSGVKR